MNKINPLDDKNTPAEFLDHLSKSNNEYIKMRVSQHRNASGKTLASLIEDDDLDRLQHSWYRKILLGVASNPNTPPHLLDILLEKGDDEISYNVALNKNINRKTLENLCYNRSGNIHCWVLSNPSLPKELLEYFSNSEILHNRELVAKHKNTPPEVLDRLSYDEQELVFSYDPWSYPTTFWGVEPENKKNEPSIKIVRFWVARNNNIADSTVERMSHDSDARIRASLTFNSSVNEKLIKRLREDKNVLKILDNINKL